MVADSGLLRLLEHYSISQRKLAIKNNRVLLYEMLVFHVETIVLASFKDRSSKLLIEPLVHSHELTEPPSQESNKQKS